MSDDEKAQRLREKIRQNREARFPQQSPAALFAAERGWQVSRPFPAERLYARPDTTRNRRELAGEFFDYFDDGRFPVGIVVHGTHAHTKIARIYADRHGLRAEAVESWRRAGFRAVLIQRPEWTFQRIN